MQVWEPTLKAETTSHRAGNGTKGTAAMFGSVCVAKLQNRLIDNRDVRYTAAGSMCFGTVALRCPGETVVAEAVNPSAYDSDT